MKRRILAILLAAIMVLSAVPFSVFAEESSACPGEANVHTKDNCESTLFKKVDPVCDLGGYSIYTCNECHKQFFADIEPAKDYPHQVEKATKAATCHKTGIKDNVWQCKVCEAYFKDAAATDKYAADDDSYIAPVLSHNWVNQKDNGDCTIDKCSKCGDERVAGNATCVAHKYYVTKFLEPVPTCASKAKANVKCSECGDEQTNVEVDNNGVPHTYGELVPAKPVTCETNGWNAYYQCSVCKEYFDESKNPADWEDDILLKTPGHQPEMNGGKPVVLFEKPATCIANGSRTYRCDECGKFIENEIIPANPIKGYWVYNTDTKEYEKDAEGNKIVVKKTETSEKTYKIWVGDKDYDYAGGEKTLTDKQEFKDAGVILHSFAVSSFPVKCDTYGYTKKVCVLCGTEEIVDIKEPLKHKDADGNMLGTLMADQAANGGKAATCSKAGVAVYLCTCGEKAYAEIPAWGHGTDKTVTNATCTADGVKFTYTTGAAGVAGWACTCDQYEKISNIDLGDPAKNYKIWDPETADTSDLTTYSQALWVKVGSVSVVAKNANNHIMREQIVNAPTCDTAGNKVDFCLACGSNTPAPLAATGHKFEITWADGTTDADKTLANILTKTTNVTKQDPDCVTDGYYKIECSNPNCDVISDANSKATNGWSLKINKLGHAEYVETVTATCQNVNGYSYKACSRCSWNTDTEEGRFDKVTYAMADSYTKDNVNIYHVVDLTGTKTEFKHGDCTTVGLDSYKCSKCEKNVLVIQGETGTHLKPETKTADNYIAYKAPTCCNSGNEEAYICQRPGCTLKDNVVGGKLEGGKLVANTIAATEKHNYVVVFNGKAPECKADGTLVNGYVTLYTCDASADCCKNQKFFVKIADCDEHDQENCYHPFAAANAGNVFVEGNVEKGVVADGNGVKILDGVRVDAKHTWDDIKVDASCNQGGHDKMCTVCGYKDNAVDSEHTIVYTKTVADTCTDKGYTIEVCGLCDYVKIHTFVDEVVHDWDLKRENVKATCYEYGGDYYECSICGAKKIEEQEAKLAHKKAELELGYGMSAHGDLVYYVCGIKEATKDAKCDNYATCGFQVTNHIAQTTKVEPTCTTYGYEVTTCADLGCRATIGTPQIYAEPTNHAGTTIIDTDRSYDPTEDTAGMTYYKCTACGKTDFAPTEVSAKATVYFDYNHVNVTTGTQDYAESNIVKVDVTVNSKLASIGGIAFDFTYYSDQVEFVKFVVPTEGNLFNGIYANDTVVDEMNKENAVKVIGSKTSPKNLDADDGKVVVVTLYFRILDGANSVDFDITNAQASKDAANGLTEKVEISAAAIAVKELIDVDEDGSLTLKDALIINELFANGGYNVSADLDKDNEITGSDLELFYNCYLKVINQSEVFDIFDLAY